MFSPQFILGTEDRRKMAENSVTVPNFRKFPVQPAADHRRRRKLRRALRARPHHRRCRVGSRDHHSRAAGPAPRRLTALAGSQPGPGARRGPFSPSGLRTKPAIAPRCRTRRSSICRRGSSSRAAEGKHKARPYARTILVRRAEDADRFTIPIGAGAFSSAITLEGLSLFFGTPSSA